MIRTARRTAPTVKLFLPTLAPPARRLMTVKRAPVWAMTDRLLAAVILLAAVPVIAMAMMAVRATSRGPALYRQTRLGRYGRPFTILKIRTMCHEAESLTGPRWSFPGDPRITWVGQILRALHLDELPQLVNVLRGEMSLVGPRPERPEIVRELRLRYPGYHRRLVVKPGLTGLAQIHLPPEETVAEVRNKLIYDRLGIQRFGFAFNLRILVLTGLKVLGLKRLYQRPPRG
jgi:lipopolysaccharide/colanic/teichoic acid biosynthesis glycosyltransferase